MAGYVKALAIGAWQLVLCPQNSHKGGRKELTPQGGPRIHNDYHITHASTTSATSSSGITTNDAFLRNEITATLKSVMVT